MFIRFPDFDTQFLANAQRIRAHVCICFVALKVYRKLGRLLKLNKLSMSVDTVLNIAKTIPTIRVATEGGSLKKNFFSPPSIASSYRYSTTNFGGRKTTLTINYLRKIIEKVSKSGKIIIYLRR